MDLTRPNNARDATDGPRRPSRPRRRSVVVFVLAALLTRSGRRGLAMLWRTSAPAASRRRVALAVIKLTAAMPVESGELIEAAGELAVAFDLGDEGYLALIEEAVTALRSERKSASNAEALIERVERRMQATAMVLELDRWTLTPPAAAPA